MSRGRCLVLFAWMLLPLPAHAVTVPGPFGPTIQAAINAVTFGALPNGEVINVQPGVYPEVLLINATPRSMTIRAINGPGTVTVNAAGGGTSALRMLNATGTVRIEGLTFTGGTGDPTGSLGGGATINDSSPTLVNVTFEGNTAVNGGGASLTRANPVFEGVIFRNNSATQFGGGLVITTGSRPVFMNSQITNNVSGTVSGVGSGGGVHSNDASPTFRGSMVSNNQSKFAGGGIVHIGVFGSPNGTATLTVEDSEVSGNTAIRATPAFNPAEGGGIHIEDNAIGRLTRTKVRNNVANSGGGLSAFRARYEITSSVLEGNQAPDPQAVGGFGGAIVASSNNVGVPLQQASTVILTDSVVRNNSARLAGGMLVGGDQVCAGGPCSAATATKATLTIADSLIDGNTSTTLGGGVLADRTIVSVTNSQVFRNQVTGGAASFGGGFLVTGASNASISNSTIAENSALQFGGGLFIDNGATVNITGSNIYRNTAGTRGGGLYVGSQGPPTGVVQQSVIADNTNFQIGEQACAPLTAPILTYRNNNIVNMGGQQIYQSDCAVTINSIAAFNALSPGNKTVNNTNNAPSFVSFLATPDVGPSVLAWSVARATSVTISGVNVFANATFTVDVSPTCATTYVLTAAPSGGPLPQTVQGMSAGGVPANLGPLLRMVDYDGDGRADLAVWNPGSGFWCVMRSSDGTTVGVQWGSGAAGDIPVPGNYASNVVNLAVFRRPSAQWLVRAPDGTFVFGGPVPFGSPGLNDTAIPADFDGDGLTDLAVYRISTGDWIIFGSSTGFFGIILWGGPGLGDLAVPADFDGDGRADLAVYRSTTGQWLIFCTGAGGLICQNAGFPGPILYGGPTAIFGDIPIPADYDGDGRADLAVYRGSTGEWIIFGSSVGQMAPFLFGAPALGDIPVPADYDGDGRADVAVWRPVNATWLIQRSSQGFVSIQHGTPADVPVP